VADTTITYNRIHTTALLEAVIPLPVADINATIRAINWKDLSQYVDLRCSEDMQRPIPSNVKLLHILQSYNVNMTKLDKIDYRQGSTCVIGIGDSGRPMTADAYSVDNINTLVLSVTTNYNVRNAGMRNLRYDGTFACEHFYSDIDHDLVACSRVANGIR